MASNTNRAPMLAYMAVIAATCWFISVVVYHWVMRDYPSSAFVLVMVFGTCVVGSVAGFALSAVANIIFRACRPKLRVALTAIVWLAVCGLLTQWLYKEGADVERTLIVLAIAAISGVVIGPMNAELIVGRWYAAKTIASRVATDSQ